MSYEVIMTDHKQTKNVLKLRFQSNENETKKQEDQILVGGRDELSITV